MPVITHDRHIIRECNQTKSNNFYHLENIKKAMQRTPFFGVYQGERTYRWIYIHRKDYWDKVLMFNSYLLSTTTGQLLKKVHELSLAPDLDDGSIL